MAKLLRLRDQLRLGLALAGDYLLPALLRAGRGMPPQKISYLGISNRHPQSFYNATSKLMQIGEIEKIIKNGLPVLRLTNKGKKKLNRDFPFYDLSKKKWSSWWCLVIFDFPEEKRRLRDYLREKLLNLNFGQLQKSVYISPYDLAEDINEFIIEKKLFGYAYVINTEHKFMGSELELVDRVWHLEELNDQYWNLANKTKDLRDKKKLTEQKTNELKQEFLNLIAKDPFLPEALLPSEWGREKAYQTLMLI